MSPQVIEGEVDLLNIAQQLQATQKEISSLNKQILNRTAYAAKSISTRKITAKVALPQDYVAGKLDVDVGDDQATVSTNLRGTLMSRYEHTQVRTGDNKTQGYKVRLRTGKLPVHFRHVFQIPLRGGNGVGLAERVGKKRYPITVLHAASPSQMMAAEMDDIAADVSAVLDTETDKALAALEALDK